MYFHARWACACARCRAWAASCSQEDCFVCTFRAGPDMMQALMGAEVDCKTGRNAHGQY